MLLIFLVYCFVKHPVVPEKCSLAIENYA